MISFQVNDMTCGHCVASITHALKGADAGADVRIDLASHRVDIEPAAAGADALREAIRQAGYTPVPVAAPDAAAKPSAAAPRGGCCGC